MYEQEMQQKQEEEFFVPHYPQLELAFKDKAFYQCNTLFIATYGAASLFLHSLIGNQKPSNQLNFSRAKQQSLADLYSLNGSVFLTFNDLLQPMKEIYLAKFITENIAFQRAIVLTSISKTTLKEPATSFLNFVGSSAFEEKSGFPRFSEGIMGLEADVLQWGEINRTPIGCFIGIFGEYELSSEIIESVFGSLRGKHGLKGSFDIGQKVKKYNMKKYSNKIYL